MSTTRIVNGVEYVIPPGTEHVWTPPEEVVASAPLESTKAIDAITGLRVQAIVRNQNEPKILALVEKAASIYQSFLDKKINAQQLADQMATFRNVDLIGHDPKEVDDVTIQNIELAILKAIAESTR